MIDLSKIAKTMFYWPIKELVEIVEKQQTEIAALRDEVETLKATKADRKGRKKSD